MSQTVVIAIGGNAITKNGQKGTVEEQMQNIRDCCDPILDLVQAGYRIVLTHGNGPQVGSILIQNEAAQPRHTGQPAGRLRRADPRAAWGTSSPRRSTTA